MRAGNQVSEASVDCAARVFVEVDARAAAEADVSANCVEFGDADIDSDTLTEPSAEVTWSEFCDEEDTVRGSTRAEIFGDVYADAV